MAGNCDFNSILTITLSGYRARHSPSPCHMVTSSHCCLAPLDKPNAVLSAILRQVSFGLPRLLLPSGAHVNAVLRCLFGSDEIPAPPEDLLTDGADVSPVSRRLRKNINPGRTRSLVRRKERKRRTIPRELNIGREGHEIRKMGAEPRLNAKPGGSVRTDNRRG